MKAKVVALTMSFCLIACSEQKIPKIAPYTKSEDVRVDIKFDRSPGPINFDIGSTQNNYYSLPDNVTIHYFPENPKEGVGSLASWYMDTKKVTHTLKLEPTLRIGCDGGDETELPNDIKTEVLELCGTLRFKGDDLQIKAETVILNDVALKAEITSAKYGYFTSGAISIVATQLLLQGDNVLSGFRDGKMRQLKGSPQMIFFIGFLKGHGTLRINSLNELPPEGTYY